MLAALALATALTTAAWAIVREFVLDKGFIGLPPVGATPSAPESGELVIQYWVGTRAGCTPKGGRRGPRDRNLPEAAEPLASGFLEQRLTPEGVELLRSEIVSTGLFGTTSLLWQHLPPQRDPGANRRPVGSRPLELPEGGWVSGSRIRRSWLPASAWANRQIRAYVASRYAILYRASPKRSNGPASCPCYLHGPRTCSAPRMPWLGRARLVGRRLLPFTVYVSDLTTEEARALARALDDGGLKRNRRVGELGYRFEIPGTSVDPLGPERGQSETRATSGSGPTSRTARWCARHAGERGLDLDS